VFCENTDKVVQNRYQQDVIEEEDLTVVLSDALATCRVDDLLETTVADETPM